MESTLKKGPSVVLTWANLPEDVANVNNLPDGGGGLDEAQVTIIARHEIATATIKVDQLTANDVENPLIRLFNAGLIGADGNPTDGNPAIDATFNMNQGIGHAVGYKWKKEKDLTQKEIMKLEKEVRKKEFKLLGIDGQIEKLEGMANTLGKDRKRSKTKKRFVKTYENFFETLSGDLLDLDSKDKQDIKAMLEDLTDAIKAHIAKLE